MGSALLARWQKNPTYSIFVVDPAKKGSYATLDTLPVKTFNIIVLAVKPQVMDETLAEIASRVSSSLYISIAAGKSLKYFEEKLPPQQAVIRMMPNTPAMVGKGMTVAVANNFCQPNHKLIAKTLFETSGAFEWANSEDIMDAVTAISGSGPAYVFLLIEVMTKAGISLGLSPDLAEKLARQTVIGSAALAEHSPDISALTLRQNVTSPGGTTAAALEILMTEPGFQQLMNKAVAAAAERSKELS